VLCTREKHQLSASLDEI